MSRCFTRVVSTLFLIPVIAHAATTTTTFNVTATVSSACSVSATDLNFGTYNPISSSPLDSTSTVSVLCTQGTTYHVRFSQGLHGSGVTDREMQRSGNAETLDYALYRDLPRTQNWGETDGTDTVDGVGTGLTVDHTVCGRVSAEQNVPTGSYSDTITVTVSY